MFLLLSLCALKDFRANGLAGSGQKLLYFFVARELARYYVRITARVQPAVALFFKLHLILTVYNERQPLHRR